MGLVVAAAWFLIGLSSGTLMAMESLFSCSGRIGREPLAPAEEAVLASAAVDARNDLYFRLLLKKMRAGQGSGESLRLWEPGTAVTGDCAYPVASAPAELLLALPLTQLGDIAANAANAAAAARTTLWMKKLQAGLGTNVGRASHLARYNPGAAAGSKGTDLFIPARVPFSVAEAQLLQSFRLAEGGHFRRLLWHDLVSTETSRSVATLRQRTCPLHAPLTYAAALARLPALGYAGETEQALMPTLDAAGALTLNRRAPAGHGFFGVDALWRALELETLPAAAEGLIGVVANGEDLSSTPDAALVGWMHRNHIPIVMLTTDKTPLDRKGGQIAVVVRADGETYVTIVETVQAQASGQLALFESLGLRAGDRVALFNTNMALFNYGELVPRLQRLVAAVGLPAFLDAITPTPIRNGKSQTDADGVSRAYTQLEGTMGSALLNLDRLWRRHFHEPLVHFVNVDRQQRTELFAPIKNAFDYFLQFHSDRFTFDERRYRVVDNRPGSLPSADLRDPASGDRFYQDVETLVGAFSGGSFLHLDELRITGRVSLRGIELVGRVTVVNEGTAAEPFALAAALTRAGVSTRLENRTVRVSPDGRVTVE